MNHWRHHHHQASGWPIATTPSERRRVNQQKAFLWQITESANDQGKKNKILTKLALVQCNLFSLSMIKFLLVINTNPNHELCAGMVAR
ncbi:MAG: hypothetical protein ACK56I_33005, partial [bacterium]